MPFQQSRRRHQPPGQIRNLFGHHTFVCWGSHQDATIKTFLHKLRRSVDQMQLSRHLRILALKPRQDPRHHPLPDIDHRYQPEMPSERFPLPLQPPPHPIRQRQQFTRIGQQRPARLRQTHGMRVTPQQRRAHLRFQSRQTPTHRRLRHSEHTRRTRDAA